MGRELVHRSRDSVVESLAQSDMAGGQTLFEHLRGGTRVSPFPSQFPYPGSREWLSFSDSEGSSVLYKFPVDPY